MEDQFTMGLLVSLPTGIKLLAGNKDKLTDDNIKRAKSFRKLGDENTKFREEITNMKSDNW